MGQFEGIIFRDNPWCFDQCNSGHIYSNDQFQSNSGNFDKMSLGTQCTTFHERFVQVVTFQSAGFPGTCGHCQSQLAGVRQQALAECGFDGNFNMVSYDDSTEIQDGIFFNVSAGEFLHDGELVAVLGTGIFNMICRLAASGWYWMNMILITLAMCTGLQVIMVACTTTAAVRLALHAWKSMSHLSWNDGMQQRLDRRRCRRSSIRVQLLCGVLNARAMEGEQTMQEAVLQRMASMAEAATRAAIAAEEALKRSTSSSSGATNPREGLSAASRILKPPDTFNGEDIMLFQQWKHQFTSWLCFGDNRYAEALDLLEKKDTAPAWSTYNDDERSMSQKLYAVLTSYLRGKCVHMVRAESKVKDGFKLWFNLNHEFMPSTRQRSLALEGHILRLDETVHLWSPS